MSISLQPGYYYIQQVAELTGLSKQLIRKWEERYQLVNPLRMDNGYRIYSDQDINLLLTVKKLIEEGQSVKQAATLIKSGEIQIKEQHQNQLDLDLPSKENIYVLKLLKEGASCNEEQMHHILHQAYHQLGLAPFLKEVMIPFLKEVGDHWERKEWSEYQEAFSSILVRDFLVQIRRNFRINEHAPLIVGACLPNEQHEIPVHMLLLFAMLKGWRTFLVGASPAPNSIESIVEKLKPKVVLLSASTTIPFEDRQSLERLDQFAGLHKETAFYMGGAGSIEFLRDKNLQHIVVTNDYDNLL